MNGRSPVRGRGSPSPGPAARRRSAPMITIDTSAGDSSLLSPPPEVPEHSPSNGRPTSPHNVSSPTGRGLDAHSFLSVPSRSRGSSIDSATDSGVSPVSTNASTSLINSVTDVEEKGPPTPKAPVPENHSEDVILGDGEALQPDPNNEKDFYVEDNRFAFSPGQLGKLIDPKSLGAFHALGGLRGLERGLRTDVKAGLSLDEEFLHGEVTFEEATGERPVTARKDDSPTQTRTTSRGNLASRQTKEDHAFADRKRIFKDNRLPEKKAKNILQLAWIAYNDKVLILLSVAAVISLALGLYQTFGQPHTDGQAPVEWVEGVAIMVAIFIVVVVGAVNDWQKERQFVKLNKKKEDRLVKVVRSGQTREISVWDILVGDVVLLEPGDLIPADGIFIDGHHLRCDESSATGESDLLKKTPADRVYQAMEANENPKKMDPFILSGSKITEGLGSFLVTATGVNSSYGKTMMSLREESEVTPLQSKLNVIAEYIAKLGGAAALLLFVVLFIEFLVRLRHNTQTPAQKGQNFLNIFIVAVTIVVVAVPEGLPLAVTLALAFATMRMLKDNNLVRVLRSCETMGNATSVCSDKTGTLTQNKMTVVAGSIGTTSRFGDREGLSSRGTDPNKRKNADIVSQVSARDCLDTIDGEVRSLFEQSVVINSTAFEGQEDGKPAYIGSKTETALLSFSRDFLGMGSVAVERSNVTVVQLMPFDSSRKCMAVVVKMASGKFRMYVKGAPEILLARCTRIIGDPAKGIKSEALRPDDKDTLKSLVESYAGRSLRTLAFVYRDFDMWPPKFARRQEDDPSRANFSDVFQDMVFFSIVGIQDPLREGVSEAVQICVRAGVFVRMVTGDNLLTAKSIASECGIYTEGGLVMEGPQFRKLSKAEMFNIIPRLQVLARSSPEDKRILVKRLKEMGETVAVTGDGTNDAPALKTADVGFSMGIAGTEVAKEASAIILMDDNFSSIVKALMWGRAVNDAVKKFLQFQVTVNITAVLLAFVSAVSSPDQRSVLNAVQLLWVNLIMDTFAALALATDPPSPSIIDRKPDPKSAPLISLTMWKMIIGQSIYQLTVTFVLYYGGKSILSYDSPREEKQLQALIFNVFVWMQIFNEFNNRRLDNKFNIFEGLHRNFFFIGITLIMIGGQILIVFVGGQAFFQQSIAPLNGAQWGYSIVLGAISIPIGIIIRLIPDDLIRRLIPSSFKQRYERRPVEVDESVTPDTLSPDAPSAKFNQALYDIRDELAFLKSLRGGRLHTLRFAIQHPRESLLPRQPSNLSVIPPPSPVLLLDDSSNVVVPLRPHRSRSATPSVMSVSGVSASGTSASGVTQGESASEFHLPHTPTDSSARLPRAQRSTRRRQRSRSNSAFASGPVAAMAGVVAGSVAGGWSPIERSTSDFGSVSPSARMRRSSSDVCGRSRAESTASANGAAHGPNPTPLSHVGSGLSSRSGRDSLRPNLAREVTPEDFGRGHRDVDRGEGPQKAVKRERSNLGQKVENALDNEPGGEEATERGKKPHEDESKSDEGSDGKNEPGKTGANDKANPAPK